MKCQECQQEFDAMHSGTLAEDVRHAAEAHLHECADCAKAFAQASELWALLGNATVIQPSHGFADRVLRRLDAEPEPARQRWFDWLHSWRCVTATAALVVVVGLTSFVIYHERQRDQQVKHFEELFNVVQNIDPDALSNGTSLDTEDAL